MTREKCIARITIALTPLALIALSGAAGASEASLSQRIGQQDGWIAYQVPMAADAGELCCYDWHGKTTPRTGCDLDGKSWSVNRSDRSDLPKDDALNVYMLVAHGRAEKVRAFAASCPISNTTPVRWLEGVNAADSVALLARAAAEATQTSRETADTELAAMAMHADASATPALAQLANAQHPRKLREQALFWLAQVRGSEGAQIVERVATTDGDAELRANAVFDLSQAHGIDAYSAVHRIAQTDSSDNVREQALFWMAQMGDVRAKADIIAAIGKDPSHSVREQAVFALSQLKDHQADAALIALVRGQYPREVKQQALFWLGQSGSDDALKFLDEVLDKPLARSADG
jgi:hypothetical protein